MFEAKDPRLNEPSLLGQPVGSAACFSDFLISKDVGMKYLSDVSGILRPSELCQLLKGTATSIVLNEVANFNALYAENQIRYSLNSTSLISTFFSCLGNLIDTSSMCEDVLDDIAPMLDDLCLTEEQVLNSVDRENINNLLDMLENGLELPIPDINLTCPIKPNYIPNPLVDHSIPQLISTLVETVAGPLYFAAEATKSILLEPVMGQNKNIALCAAGLEGQGQFEEADPPDPGPLMDDISEAFEDMMNGINSVSDQAGNLEDNINEFFQNPESAQAQFPCPDIQDVFGGVENLRAVLDALAAVFENFDASALTQLGEDLTNLDHTKPLPSVSYRFPRSVRTGVAEFMPSMATLRPFFELAPKKTFQWFPAFSKREAADLESWDQYITKFDMIDNPPPPALPSSKNMSIVTTLAAAVPLQGSSAPPGTSMGAGSADTPAGAPTSSLTQYTLGPPSGPSATAYQTITHLFNDTINNALPAEKYITTTSFFGGRHFDPAVTSNGQLYSKTEFLDVFGPAAFDTGLGRSWETTNANPGAGAFASLAYNSLNSFLKDYSVLETAGVSQTGGSQESTAGLSVDTVDANAALNKYYDALQNQYYYSAQAGLVKNLTNYCLENGTFTAAKLLKAVFVKDNSECQNDPQKIGDLMDLNGIIKRVQQEYDEGSCSDSSPQRKVVLNCVQYASVLILMQLFIAQFFLKNVFILSAFKLEDLWQNPAVVDQVLNSIYRNFKTYIQDPSLRINIPGAFEGQFGPEYSPFETVFTNVANNYMARKYNRPDRNFDPRILEVLGITPGHEAELLEEGNSVRYILIQRILDSAMAMQNIISKNATKSIEEVFIEDVIGFSEPFIVGVDKISRAPQDLHLTIDPELEKNIDLMGYGGFRLEKIMRWDQVRFIDKTTGEDRHLDAARSDPFSYHWVDQVVIAGIDTPLPWRATCRHRLSEPSE